MRKRNLLALLAVNVCLLGGQVAFAPTPAAASEQAGYDCCKESQEHIKFCCDQCCTAEDCDSSADCQKSPEES